eukprot:TRINITY_DN52183_c0_g2_i1.p1 TRINITY_DN52183_c0_g2~~TRINITY_DN52183_c0_g2_i1.p1  ORF type:complete len:195 (-),score=19.30 TRINITY_DN52183_c0_g2_i1:153-737(-)
MLTRHVLSRACRLPSVVQPALYRYSSTSSKPPQEQVMDKTKWKILGVHATPVIFSALSVAALPMDIPLTYYAYTAVVSMVVSNRQWTVWNNKWGANKLACSMTKRTFATSPIRGGAIFGGLLGLKLYIGALCIAYFLSTVPVHFLPPNVEPSANMTMLLVMPGVVFQLLLKLYLEIPSIALTLGMLSGMLATLL